MIEVESIVPIINKTENVIIIFFDLNNEFNNNTEDFKRQIHQINQSVVFHTELQSCITFIQSIPEKKIFLIIPPSSVSQIFSRIAIFNQIDNIFIFSSKNDPSKDLSLENAKIVGIYDNFDSLCTSIKEEIDRTHKCCFFDQTEYENKDLSKQASHFLWFQLFHAVLLHLPCEQQIKRQKIGACRQYCPNIVKELTFNDDFKHEYQSNEALRWFVTHPSLQKMINTALQTEDINQLNPLRFYLNDLVRNLHNEHKKVVQSNREKLTLYRVMILSNEEVKQLQENIGKLISMKSFFTATTNRSSTVVSTKPDNRISVLFEIECNLQELDDNFIVVDITEFTQLTSQQTYVFDFNASFQLKSFEQNEQIWTIKLCAVNHGETIIQKYIKDIRRQFEDLSITIIFGKLLCDMSRWNQSQEYFQRLLNDPHDEDSAWIEHSIGQTHYWKGELNEARTYYDRAYERMMKTEPARIKDSAAVVSDIGEILHWQGKYQEAFDYHHRALNIRKKYYSSHHVHIATSVENIGLIFRKKLRNDEARVFLQEALMIREKYYNYSHVDIATSLKNIACNLVYQNKFKEALIYYERAMSIYKKYYPSGHVLIASTLSDIGDVFYRQDKLEEGVDLIHQALAIQNKFYPSGHLDIATSLICMGNIKYDQEKYDESLELHYQALTMLRKYHSSDHLDIAQIFNNIGHTQLFGKRNSNEGLVLHQQALTILETYYPSYLGHIATTHYYIGNVFRQQRRDDEALDSYHRALNILKEFQPADFIQIALVLEYIGLTWDQKGSSDRATEYYEKCLKIKEASLCTENSSIVYTLSKLGHAHRTLGQYEQCLAYELKCFLMREKLLPPNHQNIGESLVNIGECYELLNKRKEALDHFKRALVIYEHCSSSVHQDRSDIELKIKRISTEIKVNPV